MTQAIKEVGGRSVLATFLVRGLDNYGKVKKPAPKPEVTISKSRVSRRAERDKRRGKVSTKSIANDKKSTQSVISESDTAVTAVDEVDEERDEPEEEQEDSPSNPRPSKKPSKLSSVSSRVRSLRFTGEILLYFTFSCLLKFIISCLRFCCGLCRVCRA